MLITIGYLIALVALGLWLASTVVIVRAKSNAVIERLGKFHSVRSPGLNFKLPYPFDVVVGNVSLQINQVSSDLGVKTKDNTFLTLPVSAQIKVEDNKDQVQKSFYELDDPTHQLTSYMMNRIRSSANGMDLQEIYDDKERIAKEVKDDLKDAFRDYGYQIVDVLID